MNLPMAFPIDTFLAVFPAFDNTEEYKTTYISGCGYRATMHVTRYVQGMPLEEPYRTYAVFLATAHILTLDKKGRDEGGEAAEVAGVPFKATVGSVSVESTKPNSFVSDDFTYYWSLTEYGRELLAYLDTQAQAIFLNTPNDTVRDLV